MFKDEIINGVIMDVYEDLPEKVIAKIRNSFITRMYKC